MSQEFHPKHNLSRQILIDSSEAAWLSLFCNKHLRAEETSMPAYMIIAAKIADRDSFINGYGKAAAVLVAQFGGQYVLRAPGAEMLEGSFGDGASVVISLWPDKDAARRFWNSPEYGEVKKLREGVADCQVLLIETPAGIGATP
jgi:uncharacterized protein (DUF1330 family)